MAKVAYGTKANIDTSIASGVIPMDCIIITSDSTSEAFYYNRNGVLNQLTQDTSFSTMNEAEDFAEESINYGRIITVYVDNTWIPYIITSNGTLMRITGTTYNDATGELTII